MDAGVFFLYTGAMPLSWGFRTQLKFFGIFAAAIFIIVGALVYFLWPAPTCFDNRQNQDEEGVDCGGANCLPCANKISELNILWTRTIKISDGVYDVAALLENANQFLSAKYISYIIKLYDSNNILVALKENSTFIYPGEKFVIFEPSISTQNRIPVRALLEIDRSSLLWEKAESKPLKIDILRSQKFLDEGMLLPARVETEIKNMSNLLYRNIQVIAVLWGGAGDVLGVSRTIIEKMDIDESKTITFTWPKAIPGVDRVEIFLRQVP